MKKGLLSLLLLTLWVTGAEAKPQPAEALTNKILLDSNRNFRETHDALSTHIALLDLKGYKPQGENVEVSARLLGSLLAASLRPLRSVKHSHEHAEVTFTDADATALSNCITTFTQASLALEAYANERLEREEDPSKMTDAEYEALKPVLVVPLEIIATNIKTAQRQLSDILFRRTGFRDPQDVDPQPEPTPQNRK